MTVTTDTDRTTTDTLTERADTFTERADTDPRVTTEAPASAFPRPALDHSPNLATLDMLRSTGRNPLLLQASRRTRPSRQRDCIRPRP